MFLDVSVYLDSLKQVIDERMKTITKIYSRRYDLFNKILYPKDSASLINRAFALYCTVITIYELTDL